MNRKFDCVSIGSATVDIILKSKEFKIIKNKDFETGTAICEMYGSKVNVDNLYVGSGGGATNSSCSLSNLGLKTSCISVIGDDVFSDLVVDDLVKFGVNYDNLIIEKGEKTAISTILTAKDGGRTVLIYRGPCSDISLKSINNKNLNTKWVYLTNLGGGSKNVHEVISFLKQKNIKIFWNPGLNELEEINTKFLKNVDILNLNMEEAGKLSGLEMIDPKGILKFFVSKVSAKVSLITMGEKGAFYIAEKKVIHVSSLKTKVGSTLGAGDAFGSGFLYGIVKTLGIEKSLEYAVKNSVSDIQKVGAKEGFLKELDAFPTPTIRKISN